MLIWKGLKGNKHLLYLATFLLSISCISLVCAFWSQPELLALLLLANSMLMVWAGGSRREAALFVAVAVLGALAEVAGIMSGAWQYRMPQLVIPVWLPLVWGTAGLYIVRMYGALWFYLSPASKDAILPLGKKKSSR